MPLNEVIGVTNVKVRGKKVEFTSKSINQIAYAGQMNW
jgi:hypothetical protein